MPDQPTRQYVVTEGALRFGFLFGSIGMIILIVALLVLITARPQGRYQPLDASQHRQLLADAEGRLSGFELRENGVARIDIDRAMELVAERGVDLEFAPAVAEPPEEVDPALVGAADGLEVYAAQCMACHQADGSGVPGAFPPLARHVGQLYAADPAYLVQVTLYGLQGPIVVDGVNYAGVMPAFARLSDAEIAALLNHSLTAWGDAEALGADFVPFDPDDVQVERDRGWTAADVHARRAELDLD
jgi:mono/diheme cytochrome c family protein